MFKVWLWTWTLSRPDRKKHSILPRNKFKEKLCLWLKYIRLSYESKVNCISGQNSTHILKKFSVYLLFFADDDFLVVKMWPGFLTENQLWFICGKAHFEVLRIGHSGSWTLLKINIPGRSETNFYKKLFVIPYHLAIRSFIGVFVRIPTRKAVSFNYVFL